MSPEARRQTIVDAAVGLILELGHSGVTLEQVAERVGIRKAIRIRRFINSSSRRVCKAFFNVDVAAW